MPFFHFKAIVTVKKPSMTEFIVALLIKEKCIFRKPVEFGGYETLHKWKFNSFINIAAYEVLNFLFERQVGRNSFMKTFCDSLICIIEYNLKKLFATAKIIMNESSIDPGLDRNILCSSMDIPFFKKEVLCSSLYGLFCLTLFHIQIPRKLLTK